MKSSKEENGTARRKSRTFSKPNCFSSAMETVEWMSSWATEADVDACCGVANGIHFAAFPIAMLCGGRAEGSKGKGREGGYQRHVDGDTDDSVVYVEDDRLQRGRAPLCYVNGPRTSWLRPQAGLATHSSPSNLIPRNRQPATTRPHLSSTLLGPSLSPYFSQYSTSPSRFTRRALCLLAREPCPACQYPLGQTPSVSPARNHPCRDRSKVR